MYLETYCSKSDSLGSLSGSPLTMRRSSNRRSSGNNVHIDPLDYYPRCAVPGRPSVNTYVPRNNKGCSSCALLCYTLLMLITVMGLCYLSTKYDFIALQAQDYAEKQNIEVVQFKHLMEDKIHQLEREIESLKTTLREEVLSFLDKLNDTINNINDTIASNLNNNSNNYSNGTLNNGEARDVCKQNTDEQVEEKIEMALAVFEADKTGMFDYAAQYAGGAIISTPETIPYPVNQTFVLFGILELRMWSKPESLIQPSQFPGDCFVFEGTHGKIIIELGTPIIITAVSLEHISHLLVEDQSSAPKDFAVLGLEEPNADGEMLGQFQYEIGGNTVQTFNITNQDKKYGFVMLHILTNHGKKEFTCVYRFRVHSVND